MFDEAKALEYCVKPTPGMVKFCTSDGGGFQIFAPFVLFASWP
jgi:hypothetical protein